MIIVPSFVVAIDDDVHFLDSLKNLIKASGFEAETFHSPHRASDFVLESEKTLQDMGFYETSPYTDDGFENLVEKLLDQKPPIISVLSIDHNMINITGLEWLELHPFHAQKMLVSGVLGDTGAVEAFNRKKVNFFLQKGSADFVSRFKQGMRELNFDFFAQFTSKNYREDVIQSLKNLYMENQFDFLLPRSTAPIFEITADNRKGILHVFDKDEKLIQLQYAKESGAAKDVLALLEKKDMAFCHGIPTNSQKASPKSWTAEDIVQLTNVPKTETFVHISYEPT